MSAELRAFSPQPSTRPDPGSPIFDARAWLKAFAKPSESEVGSSPARSLGIAFHNLDVFGWGSGAEYQKGSMDYPLGVVSFLVDFFSTLQKETR